MINEVSIPVLLKKELNDKLIWFVANYKNEISGWLTGEYTDEGIVIDDILIPEQEVGQTSVDTIGANLVKLRREYKDKCMRIIGHWHSHNTMQAHWSQTDEEFIKQVIEPRDKFLFIVSSKDDGHLIRLELKKPFRISIDSMPFSVESNNKIQKFCERVIEKKVKETTYPSITKLEDPWDTASPLETDETEVVSIQYEKELEAKRLISYDKNGWIVKVGPVYWYKANEIQKDFSQYSPELDLNKSPVNYVIFDCGRKRMAKQLMRELKLYLIDYIDRDYVKEDLGY